MKTITETLRPTVASLAVFTFLLGGFYPLLCTSAMQTLFPAQAEGSLLKGKDGKLLGSALIGQNVSDAKYFWGRLSATGPYPYNASASSGSNLGSNNPALMDAVKARAEALQKADSTNNKPIPVDLVTASGSGLDPHISLAAAEYQMSRIATQRGMSIANLQVLVGKYTEGRQLGFLGEPRVNVLKLNLALDRKLD